MSKRVLVCGLIGLSVATLCWKIPRGKGIQWEGDFYWWPVRAAKDLCRRKTTILVCLRLFACAHPLPAAILALPFSVIPERLGLTKFIGLSSCLLAFALTKEGYWSLLSCCPSHSWEPSTQFSGRRCFWHPCICRFCFRSRLPSQTLVYQFFFQIRLADPSFIVPFSSSSVCCLIRCGP